MQIQLHSWIFIYLITYFHFFLIHIYLLLMDTGLLDSFTSLGTLLPLYVKIYIPVEIPNTLAHFFST